jgi:hypothetical protein
MIPLVNITGNERRVRTSTKRGQFAKEEDFQPRPLHRFTVEQFQKMIALGIFPPDERLELLDGLVVKQMTQNPPHVATLDRAQETLRRCIPAGWYLREQKPIHLTRSQPEPDLTVVRGSSSRYIKHHPRPADIALVAEVADTSLEDDRHRKARIYARAKIPVYWSINLLESKLEVYTNPKGGKKPAYRQRQDFAINERVPLLIQNQEVATIVVRDLFAHSGEEA